MQPISERRDRRVLATFGLTGLLVLVVASAVVLLSRGDGAVAPGVPGDAVPAEGRVLSPAVPAIAPPPELVSSTEPILEALSREMEAWVDSLRVDRELEDGPPRGWLGGFYLSHAGAFPEVPVFWDDYRDFLADLQGRDAERYREAAREVARTRAPEGVAPEVVEAYLEERYAALGPLREDRYATLIRVAEAANRLHAFLVEAEDRIAHAPALGRGISPDPILEAVPRDEETRERLDDLLDELFQALDRSRGGGAPSFEGLRAELYGRFGQPV